ncbi:GvpL/GvpF family gas vesicle protein [Patescibacteria group bacterium]|nr:GvpL/GvpF family gas vesicle protein [Patescibacteria group bacterium]
METEAKEGKYIYCIIDSSASQSFGPLGIGGRDDEVYTIPFKDISVVVSNSPIKKYPVSRENTLAHEKAIEEVMKEYTVLPVRYCTITETEEKVKRILEKEYDKFKGLLDGIRGKKELGLKAIFKEEVIYKDILENYGQIRALKEKVAALPPEKTYYQRMQIGEMVEKALEEKKEKHKEQILDVLEPLADEVKVNYPYGERMILSAAFLVDKAKEAEFDRNIHKLYEEFGDKIKFKYVGTIPPFNFVNLVIETGAY